MPLTFFLTFILTFFFNAVNSALLPSEVMIIDFASLTAQRLLAGNSSIDRCHVTSKQPMRPRSVGEKIPQTKQVLLK